MTADRTGVPVPRWLGESLAIITSILLAFGIDAAWDARQDAEARDAIFSAYPGSPELVAVWNTLIG